MEQMKVPNIETRYYYQKQHLGCGHKTGYHLQIQHYTPWFKSCFCRLLTVTFRNLFDLSIFQFLHLKIGENDIYLEDCGEV